MKVLDGVCTHVTSSAASRDSAVKLSTDSYQFWVAHYNQRVTFQSHIRFARKVQNLVMRFQSPLVYKKYDGNPAEIRSYSKDRCNLGTSAKLIFNEIHALHGDHTISYKTVARWTRNFGSVRRASKITQGLIEQLAKSSRLRKQQFENQ